MSQHVSPEDDQSRSEPSRHSQDRTVPQTPVESVFQRELERTYGRQINPSVELRADPLANATAARIQKLRAESGSHQRYVLEGEIGRGGMGAVLKIFDADLRRSLAMKVVLGQSGATGDDTSKIDQTRLLRFLEEAQVTGQLDHPGVVPVHELGIDSEGRVYFTMRLVKGQELSEIFNAVHAGDPDWNLPRALGLLLKVCEAMSYAHDKGVVHRDLKPGNIMVGRHGEVYVMDWGLARVEGREDAHDLRLQPTGASFSALHTDRGDVELGDLDSPLVTMDGSVVGTPFFMPPEQAAGRLAEIGPHSDVYALGAMLYHLLTGCMPYHTPGDHVSPHTILARVLQGPPRTLAELAPELQPELQAICEKAMAREQSERYRDMGELSADLRAYLENRVVHAFRTGATVELKKWVQRNRALAAAALALLVLTVGGSTTATVVLGAKNDAIRTARDEALDAKHRSDLAAQEEVVLREGAVHARLEAELAQSEAEAAYSEADRARSDAESARAASEGITEFLVHQLEALEPEATRGRAIQVSEILDRAARSVEEDLEMSPLDSARLRSVLGGVYYALGMYEPAEPLLERAWKNRKTLLGADDPDTLSSLGDMAMLYRGQGRYTEAQEAAEQALARRREVLGKEDPATLESLCELAAVFLGKGNYKKAAQLFGQSLELRQRVLGVEHLETLVSLHGLGQTYSEQARHVDAEEILARVYEKRRELLGEDHPHTLQSMTALALSYKQQQRPTDAEALFIESLEITEVVLGSDHPLTLESKVNLANTLADQGRYPDAESLYDLAIEKSRAVLGERHPKTLLFMNDLAFFYELDERPGKAERLYREALRLGGSKLRDHPNVLFSKFNLASLLGRQERFDEADRLYIEALNRSIRVLGVDHPDTLFRMYALGRYYIEQNRWGEAEPHSLLALSKMVEVLGPGHRETIDAQRMLNSLYGRWLSHQLSTQGVSHPETLDVARKTAAYHARWGLPDKAEELYLDCLDRRIEALGVEHADSLVAYRDLADFYASQGRWEEAEPPARELLSLTPEHAEDYGERAQLLQRIVLALDQSN